MKYDVYGLGNALLDITIRVDDDDIKRFNLKKGITHMYDLEKINSIVDDLNKKQLLMTPAGDCANTMLGIANLGGAPVFCGVIGTDSYGKVYEDTLKTRRVFDQLVKRGNQTGRCISLITPDGQRTMLTFLGSAILIEEKDIDEKNVKNSEYLYVTGYILEDKNLRKAALNAIFYAKKHNKKIILNYSDAHLVGRIKEDLIELTKKYVDIVFCNSDEAKTITGEGPEKAVGIMSKWVKTAIVTSGINGSIIQSGNTIHKIPAFKVKAIDSTGAGDGYVAGLIYGLINKFTLQKAALLGSFYASKIVSQVGATLQKEIPPEEIDKALERKIG